MLSLCIGLRDLSLLVLSIGLLTIVLVPAMLCCQLRALALLFSFPSVQTILNLYCPNSLAYLVCLQLSTFVVVKCTRFLWSVQIVSSEQLSAYTLQCCRHATIASNSLSCTLYRSSSPKNFLKQYATRCHLSSVSMLAQPPRARSNALVLIFISTPSVNILRHSSVTHAVLSLLKASSASLLHTNGVSFYVSRVIGITIFKKS